MNDKNSLLTRILFNNKIMVVLSLVISFCIWVTMCISTGEEITKRIANIPIKVELSQDAVNNGLKNYTDGTLKAEVTVKGNRLTIGSLTAEDIEIVASQANTITAPGTYTLELSAKKIGMNTGYEFSSSIYPSTVIVTIDRMREVSFPIINNLNYSIAQGFYEGTTQYSVNEVIVSGPEAEVSRVEKVAVMGNIEDELNETKTVSEQIILLDAYGQQVQNDRITISQSYVDVTIPVDYKKTLDVVVKLINNGNDFLYTNELISVLPKEIEVAGPYDELKDIKEVMVATIDLADVTTSTLRKIVSVELPAGWKNISNISTVTVDFDMSGYISKTFEITNFDVSGHSDLSNATVSTKSLTVTVIGPKSELDKIKVSDIKASVDFSNKADDYSGTAELGLNVILNSNSTSRCWVAGSYTVTVDIVLNR